MKYLVELWEFERGWGSKRFDTKSFDSEEEAKIYEQQYNSKNCMPIVPDYYTKARYIGAVKS